MNFRQVHLDFHTSEHVPGVGSRFDKKQFQQALLEGHVNSITVFSKCHHGWAYHPSKANKMHPTLEFDLLGAQIEAAHEIGVKTPVYLSAGFDEKIVLEHPEWLRMETPQWAPDFSSPHYHLLCFNTPYLDYLLEQIKEVCENYDADGIFLDIVGVRHCYCANCMKTLRAEGKSYLDEEAVHELGERVYANYTRRVREVIDSVKPGLPVFHNGGHIPRGRRDIAYMNSHLELESLPTGGWGYDHFPLSSRYVQNLGQEYLGMTGKFHRSWGEFGGFKHPNALRYEVSLAAANGAKSSVGDQLHPDGEMDLATYRLIGAAYSELETKEPWLDSVKPVADVALLSLEACTSHNHAGGIKTMDTDAGAVRMLLEGKYLFDVVDTQSDLSRYKVVILPDEVRVNSTLKAQLDAFVAGGGKLLATGTSGLLAEENAFAFDFGAAYVGVSEKHPCYFVPDFPMEGLFDSTYVLYSEAHDLRLEGGKVLGGMRKPYFNRTVDHFCSHKHTPYAVETPTPAMVLGESGIYISWPIFHEYAQEGALILKRMFQHAMDTLLGDRKTLQTNLGAQGVVTLMKQENRYVNHLLYAVPVKRGSVEIIEDIYPVYDVDVALRLPETIHSVTLQPQGEEIPFTCENGKVSFRVKKLDCHQMVELAW